MNREFFINHPQDKKDAFDMIDVPYPYKIIIQRLPATPKQEDEYEKRRKLLAYFHRSLCPEYAKAEGVTEERAKIDLALKFARVEEVVIDKTGEYDVMWVDNDKTYIVEQGKRYLVESLGGMGNDRLSDFINNVKDYLLLQYGIFAKEFINTKTKKI